MITSNTEKIFGVFPTKYLKKRKEAAKITIAKEIGLSSNAFAKSSLISETIARVMPHPGHGNPVIRIIGQDGLDMCRESTKSVKKEIITIQYFFISSVILPITLLKYDFIDCIIHYL